MDVLSIHSRRNRTTYLHNHPDVSPDVIRARSQSPYSTSSTSTSPSSLSPLPANALPTRSTSLRRPTMGAIDSASLSKSGRSFGSSLSPDSTSPPSSYGFHSANQPSDSSVSSRAPSVYVDGDDDYSDPGTATASRFGVSAAPTSVFPRVRMTSSEPGISTMQRAVRTRNLAGCTALACRSRAVWGNGVRATVLRYGGHSLKVR